jgi:hypothetical protein
MPMMLAGGHGISGLLQNRMLGRLDERLHMHASSLDLLQDPKLFVDSSETMGGLSLVVIQRVYE